MTNFGIKTALFRFFRPIIFYWGIFGQEFQKYYCHI